MNDEQSAAPIDPTMSGSEKAAFEQRTHTAGAFDIRNVIGGLLAFIFLLIRSTMGRFTPAQATSAIVVSYYWHFVDVVWIALFAVIYLLR